MNNGCKFEKLKIVYLSDENRIVHSKAKIEKDEIFLSVPFSMAISEPIIISNPICKEVMENDVFQKSFLDWITKVST